MKRLALVASCLLLFCAGANYAGAQNWPAGMPGPGFGGPPGVGIPGLGAPVGGPNCGTSLCQPMPPCPQTPALFGSYAAWQVTTDPGTIKFSTRGAGLVIGEEATSIQFNVNGVWVGASARVPLGDWVSARAEGRILVPSTETATNLTQFAASLPVSREFAAKHQWGIIDGALAINCIPGFSVLGGLRWDSFNVSLTNPTTIPGFSSIFDESNLTISAIEPYLGFEAAWAGNRSALVLKGIGSPWVSTRTILGVTFGDPIGARTPVRDDTDTISKRAAFQELSLNYIVRMSCLVNVGAFATVNTLWAHSENDVNSAQVNGTAISQTFDIDLNRTIYMVGGSLSMAFGPFM
ncbi:MAG: hypothetical protein ACLP5H_04365 [Desulfomonilaceae bacterium]